MSAGLQDSGELFAAMGKAAALLIDALALGVMLGAPVALALLWLLA